MPRPFGQVKADFRCGHSILNAVIQPVFELVDAINVACGPLELRHSIEYRALDIFDGDGVTLFELYSHSIPAELS